MEIASLIGYGASGLQILLALVLLIVGVAVLRPVNATGGYLAAAAGGLRLLMTCCNDVGLEIAMREVDYDLMAPLSYVRTFLFIADHLLFWGLVVAAAAVTANSVQQVPR